MIPRPLKYWLADGRYDVHIYEDLLKENFGNSRRVFVSPQSHVGAKVAVTATTISNAFPFVFSNYNRVGTRHSDSGKSTFQPELEMFSSFFQVTSTFVRLKSRMKFTSGKREYHINRTN